jgi:hypothetical protein
MLTEKFVQNETMTKKERRAYRQAYYAANREKELAYSRAYCAAHREERKAWNAAHPEKLAAYSKIYYANHKEEYEDYRTTHRKEIAAWNKIYYATHKKEIDARNKAYYHAHKKERAVKRWTYHVQSKYKLSKTDFETMFNNQNNVCAICKKANWNGKKPFIDHDHKSGKVRGILCHSCNIAMGLLKENPSIMREMINYLSLSNI